MNFFIRLQESGPGNDLYQVMLNAVTGWSHAGSMLTVSLGGNKVVMRDENGTAFALLDCAMTMHFEHFDHEVLDQTDAVRRCLEVRTQARPK